MEGEIEGEIQGDILDVEMEGKIEGDIEHDIEGEGETLPSETMVAPNFAIFLSKDKSSKSCSLMTCGITRFRSLRRSMCK